MVRMGPILKMFKNLWQWYPVSISIHSGPPGPPGSPGSPRTPGPLGHSGPPGPGHPGTPEIKRGI